MGAAVKTMCREQVALLVLLLILVLVVALTAPLATAVAVAGLAAAALALVLRAPPPAGGASEGFYGPPGAPPPTAVMAPAAPPRPYPGAFYTDALDGDAAFGVRDRIEGDTATAPEGNRFNDGREYAPDAAGPCTDDEANDAEIDGDERLAYSGLSRNDPTRPTAGTINRLEMMRPYLSEEVSEAEDREWWGQYER